MEKRVNSKSEYFRLLVVGLIVLLLFTGTLSTPWIYGLIAVAGILY
jgi:hypothetical protein